MSERTTTVQPIAVYVEDDDQWREDVEEYIRRFSGIEFGDFIAGSSIEEVRGRLYSVLGPMVILVDLRLGRDKANYSGYHWLLEDLRPFVSRNASTEVFVISGNLHEAIQETLERRGIPEDHIYDKGDWAEERDAFLDVLRKAVAQMDDTALANITRGASGQEIDSYLIHTFRAIQEEIGRDISETRTHIEEPILLPMLVRTRDEFWEHEGIPDLQVLGQTGNIFSCLGGLRTITALERDADVVDVEASRPGADPDCHLSLPFVRAEVVHQQSAERGDSALIGIIDTGLDVLHEAFRDASGKQTRILAIWDQTDESGPHPAGQKIGREYTQEAINAYIKTGNAPENLTVHPQEHGTHVASIAAGRPVGSFFGGIAPEAKIVVVIPALKVDPGTQPVSLGYSVSHQLALDYIRNIAQREELPVVINVSQGMNAGAHDGTSNLEKVFDLIIDNGKKPGIAVVKSAGNERNRGGHACLRMASNSSESLKWKSKRLHFGSDVVELWFKASDRFRFRLCDPKSNMTEWVDWSNPKEEGYFPTGNHYQMSLVRYHPDNGDSRFLITITGGQATLMEPGMWSLEIESGLVRSSGEIHAWLERRNDRPMGFVNHLAEYVTLSIPATANYVISVGSVHSSMPYRLGDHSSYGPTRDGRYKPDLAAPGEGIRAAESGSSNGAIDMSGTSMAAPHVTGAIALLFSYRMKQHSQISNWRQFNAAQIQAAITQASQNYSGNWHPGMGFGILDVERLFRELGSA
jgi:subtilisin family serine protease